MDIDSFMNELSHNQSDNSFFNDKPASSRPIPLLSDKEKMSVCGKRIIPVFDPLSGINRQIVYYCRFCDKCKEYKKMSLFRKLRKVIDHNGGKLYVTIASDKAHHRRLVRNLDGEYTSVPIDVASPDPTPFMLGEKCVFSREKLEVQSFSVNTDELEQIFVQNNLSDSQKRVSGNLHKLDKKSESNNKSSGKTIEIKYREIRGDIDKKDILKAQAIAVKQTSIGSEIDENSIQEIIENRQQKIVKLLSSWGYDVYLSSEKTVTIDAESAVENILQSCNVVAENIPKNTPIDVVASIREQDKGFNPAYVKINPEK